MKETKSPSFKPHSTAVVFLSRHTGRSLLWGQGGITLGSFLFCRIRARAPNSLLVLGVP